VEKEEGKGKKGGGKKGEAGGRTKDVKIIHEKESGKE
jgi:hypothetical protein